MLGVEAELLRAGRCRGRGRPRVGGACFAWLAVWWSPGSRTRGWSLGIPMALQCGAVRSIVAVRVVVALRSPARVVDVDLLLADFFSHLLLVGDRVLVQPTRSLGTTRVSTTGSSSCSTTSCSSSEISGPAIAWSTLASLIGSLSTRTSSRCTGKFYWT